MSSPLNLILREGYTSDGTAHVINLNGSVDWVIARNISNLNAPVNNQYVGAEWFAGMNNATALVRSYTGAQPATSVVQTAANGFSLIDNSDQNAVGASIVTTATTAASPAVVSTGTTAALTANTTIVRIFRTTNMTQIAPMDFTVGAVVGGVSFGLRWLSAIAGNGFAAPGTGGTYRVISNDPNYSPRQFYITRAGSVGAITRLTLSVNSTIAVGEEIRVSIPDNFGMVQLDGLTGTVVAIGAADASGLTNTIDLDINSSTFTAFTFPASAATLATSFPQAIRFGNVAVNVLAPTDNISSFELTLGTAVSGPNLDLMEVLVFSGTQI